MAEENEEQYFEVTCANENEDNHKFVYECSACNMSFPDVEEHLKQHHAVEEEIIEVNETEAEILDDDEEYEGTLFVIKNSDGKFECRENSCGRTFKSVKPFLTHVKSHKTLPEESVRKLKEQIKQLEESPKTFEEDVDEVGTRNYRCKICSTVFNSRKRMLLHYPIHTNVAAAHKKRSHVESADDPINCKLCNRSLSNNYEMEMHMKAHAENNAAQGSRSKQVNLQPRKKKKGEPVYPCQYCQKEFKRPHEKVKHERIHTGEKPYSCEICGKRFRVTYCLSLHKRNVHSDERPYVCSFEGCSKRFKSQSVYNHHLNTHGSERKYKCNFCTKAFKTSVQLSGHKNTHTKPFSCKVCSRAFSTLYAVKLHMAVHDKDDTDLKYTCKFCSAQYGRSFALSDHIKNTHGGSEEEVCGDSYEHYVVEESQQETLEEEDTEVYSVVLVSDDDAQEI